MRVTVLDTSTDIESSSNLTDRVDIPGERDEVQSDCADQSQQIVTDESDGEISSQCEPITLNDFIKTSGLVGTGGQAKMLIQSGEVMVNGVWETRRRRKLWPGDAFELLGRKVIVAGDGGSR